MEVAEYEGTVNMKTLSGDVPTGKLSVPPVVVDVALPPHVRVGIDDVAHVVLRVKVPVVTSVAASTDTRNVSPRTGGVNVTEDAEPDELAEHTPLWSSFVATSLVPSLL